MIAKTKHEFDVRYDADISVWKERGQALVRIEDADKTIVLDLSAATGKKLQAALIKHHGT